MEKLKISVFPWAGDWAVLPSSKYSEEIAWTPKPAPVPAWGMTPICCEEMFQSGKLLC